MSKAEEFIKSKIRIGSNTSSNGWRRKGVFIPSCSLPWLTPDDARKAVEIAREEVIEKAQDWIADTFKYDGSNDFNGGSNDAMSMLLDDFTEYIKQAMKESNGG